MGFLGKLFHNMIRAFHSEFMEWATKTTVSGCLITSVSTFLMHLFHNFWLNYRLLQSSLYRKVITLIKGKRSEWGVPLLLDFLHQYDVMHCPTTSGRLLTDSITFFGRKIIIYPNFQSMHFYNFLWNIVFGSNLLHDSAQNIELRLKPSC